MLPQSTLRRMVEKPTIRLFAPALAPNRPPVWTDEPARPRASQFGTFMLGASAILAMSAVCFVALYVLLADLLEASRPILVHFQD